MKRLFLTLLMPALVGAIAPTSDIPLSTARLPGFAAELVNRPLARGPDFWVATSHNEALEILVSARPYDRQSARWDYALEELATQRAPEALGVLDTMLGDDPDMSLVPAFRLARGASYPAIRAPAQRGWASSSPAHGSASRGRREHGSIIARAAGMIDGFGSLLPGAKSALLALRYDPEAEIESVADYAHMNVARLRQAGARIGETASELSRAAYVGNHLDPGDAIRFYN